MLESSIIAHSIEGSIGGEGGTHSASSSKEVSGFLLGWQTHKINVQLDKQSCTNKSYKISLMCYKNEKMWLSFLCKLSDSRAIFLFFFYV